MGENSIVGIPNDGLFNEEPFGTNKDDYKRTHKRAVQTGMKPSHLYKFYSINENLFRVLQSSSLYFNSPLSFNDPFDGKWHFNTDELQQILIKQKLDNLKIQDPELYNQIIENNCQVSIVGTNQTILYYNLYTAHICCFSTERTNTLLWAHYADNHRGVCLEFDTLEDSDLFSQGEYVRYVSQLPDLSLPRDRKKIRSHLFFTKYNEWAYESEFRLFRLYDNKEMNELSSQNYKTYGGNIGKTIPFKKNSLKKVIVGCGLFEFNFSFANYRKFALLLRLVKENYPDATFSYAKKSETSFSLNFEDNLTYQQIIDVIYEQARAKMNEKEEQRQGIRDYNETTLKKKSKL